MSQSKMFNIHRWIFSNVFPVQNSIFVSDLNLNAEKVKYLASGVNLNMS